MNFALICLFALLPVVYWWRFKDTPLDRDYCPYAYPAWMHTPYLMAGHMDIKPPLIHWLYKIWLYILPTSRVKLIYSLRLMPLVGQVASVVLLGMVGGWRAALIAGLLWANPYMWPHMANTEWLGVALVSAALVLAYLPINPVFVQLFLGVMWISNIKNIPLSLSIGLYLLGVSFETPIPAGLWRISFQCLPLLASFVYMVVTRRGHRYWTCVFGMLVHFGKVRRVTTNIEVPLLKKAFAVELLPFIACLDYMSPWTWFAILWAAINIASKQIVPHHLILLIPFFALGCHVTPFLFVAYGITWGFRNLIIWRRPDQLYPATFGWLARNPQGILVQNDYGQVLKDAKPIIEWIKAETKPDETILICGIDNNILTETGRRTHTMVLPEYSRIEGTPPRIAIHCHLATAVIKDWYVKWGYKARFTTPLGTLTVMERRI